MTPVPGPGPDTRDHRLSVRVTAAGHTQLRDYATAHGCTVGTAVRALLREALGDFTLRARAADHIKAGQL